MNLVVTSESAFKQYQAMTAEFEHALKAHPQNSREFWFAFAGQSVRMRVVGCEMAKTISQPLSHLQLKQPASAAQLSLDLWDEDETGIPHRREGLNSDGCPDKIVQITDEGRFVGQRLRNFSCCYDRESKRIVSSLAWKEQVSLYDRWKPLSRPLLEWYNDEGVQVVHAGLVAQDGQGVLFIGKSGSGKSTAALSCLCDGFEFVGEDYVGLQRVDGGSFLGHSLYNSVFLKSDHLTRFPSLSSYVVEALPHDEKSAVILSQIYPESLRSVSPIRVLILPRIVDTLKSTAHIASKGEALLKFATSSLLKFPSRRLGVPGFNNLGKLVESLPCYWLNLGRDITSIPDVIRGIVVSSRFP
jgi:hypothetical protein